MLWTDLEGVSFEPAELSQNIAMLAAYKSAILRKQEAITRQIQQKMEQERTAFADYCNIPFYLHAILIHEGTAESGHYYSFIYDRKQDVWWRFSDINVSIEIEEVVFREAFGGQVASRKTAHSLIYINEFCKQAMEDKIVSPFLMGKFMNIPGDLRDRVTVDNNTFTMAFNNYGAQRTADAIRRRFHEKKRQIVETKQQLDQILHLPLVNFIFHLSFEKKTVFADWVILNQAAYDELSFEAGGLRRISTDPQYAQVFAELQHEFKSGFMSMSEKDEQALDTHKRTFKEEKRRYSIAAFAFKTFSEDIGNWRNAHSAIQWLRNCNGPKKVNDSLDTLMNDLIKVYILDSLTTTMSLVLSLQGEQAVRVHTGAAIACY